MKMAKCIYEQIYSNITNNITIGLKDVFPGYHESGGDDRTIFGEDIEDLLQRLQNAKEELKRKDDDTNWEMTFEVQTIALCEFALEHGYGIELS